MPFEVASGLLKALYSPLFYQYVKGEERVFQLYNGDFRSIDSFKKRALFLKKKRFPRGTDRLLAESGSIALQNINREKEQKDDKPCYVITGQQPGILGGALYVPYKVLTAINLANEMQECLGMTVRPLFWVAGEDHNLFGITRTFIPPPDRGGALRLRLEMEHFGLPAGEIKVPPEKMIKLINKLEKLTEVKEKDENYDFSVLNTLRRLSVTEHTLGSWFIAVMSYLFEGHGLYFVDPLLANRKKFYTELLLQVVEEGPILHSLIAIAERKIAAEGFIPQVRRSGKESLLMIVWKGRRQVLWREGESFFTSNKDFFITKRNLKTLIRERPELFSPNVLMRPIFQDSIFANLAYVCGPGELGYMAQIKEVYEHFGLKMPLLYPRKGVTLVEPKLRRHLEYYNISAEEAILQAQNKPRRKRRGKEDPRFEVLRENLWPRSRPQERVFNLFPFLVREGFSFWENFCYQFAALPAGHYFYSWGEGENRGG